MMLLIASSFTLAQNIQVKVFKFCIKHGDMSFYLDKDTNSLVSTHKVLYKDLLELDSNRDGKWHREKPYGPYSKKFYSKTGYDLGHLTPSNITSYDDSLNYHSFSYFNQAPQLVKLNRGKWSQLEKKVISIIKKKKADAVIVTGVTYSILAPKLPWSRIKIPYSYYKILVFADGTSYCWSASNVDGTIKEVLLKDFFNIKVTF